MKDITPLRLLAEDAEDLKIISAAVQDGLAQIGDLKYEPRQRRFSVQLNRFRWERAGQTGGRHHERAQAALAVDGVLAARVRGLPRGDTEMIVSLLAIEFEADSEPPSGRLRLILAGDGEIELDVECLDVTLADLGPVWTTKRKPDHDRGPEKG
jgi:hypothetical protein